MNHEKPPVGSPAVDYHERMARLDRGMARTYRSYLTHSTDPAQREWAETRAVACEIAAKAEEDFADVLRSRALADIHRVAS